MITPADEVMEQPPLASEGVLLPLVQRPEPNFWLPESKFFIIFLTAICGSVLGARYG